MSQQKLLEKATQALDQIGIRYMITGSVYAVRLFNPKDKTVKLRLLLREREVIAQRL